MAEGGFLVRAAIGKKNKAIDRVSQLGMRIARASPAPATIINKGKRVIERKWIMRVAPARLSSGIVRQPHTQAVKAGLTSAISRTGPTTKNPPAMGRWICNPGNDRRAPRRWRGALPSYVPVEMWVARFENWLVMAPARVGMTAIRATPMAAAMRPYSMAVAPDSSFTNFTNLIIFLSKGFGWGFSCLTCRLRCGWRDSKTGW